MQGIVLTPGRQVQEVHCAEMRETSHSIPGALKVIANGGEDINNHFPPAQSIHPSLQPCECDDPPLSTTDLVWSEASWAIVNAFASPRATHRPEIPPQFRGSVPTTQASRNYQGELKDEIGLTSGQLPKHRGSGRVAQARPLLNVSV